MLTMLIKEILIGLKCPMLFKRLGQIFISESQQQKVHSRIQNTMILFLHIICMVNKTKIKKKNSNNNNKITII